MATTEQNPNSNPLENIALTFSGGGYRAAAFALGVLSYFDRAQFKEKSLLQHVKAISTVSGGTITGACYSVNTAMPFPDFYKKMYKFLEDDQLMDHAMKKLENNEHWKKNHKKQSLINAFAEAYHDLLAKETFGMLMGNQSHLEDVIFNATEFNNANVFRFQTTGLFGNQFVICKELNAAKGDFLIADAIAASSCFPLGFEPIVFPDDFMKHDNPNYKALKRKPEFTEGLGLMDGGIVDNQGVNSIIQADNRRAKRNNQFDLIMICDVGGPLMKHWTEEPRKEINGRTISQLANTAAGLSRWAWIPALLLLVGIGLAAASEKLGWGDILIWIGGIITGIALVLFVLWLVTKVSLKLSKVVAGMIANLLPVFARTKLKYFDELALGLLQRMLKERVTSAISMTSEVFMKQVRRFTYYQIYENESWKYRRTSNLIYELTQSNFEEKKKREKRLFQFADPALQQQGDKIAHAASIASSTGTTLWFSDDDRKVERLNHLIACGQFTTCFNLLYYLGEIKNDPDSPYKNLFAPGSDLQNLYDWLLDEWKKFKDGPLRLI